MKGPEAIHTAAVPVEKLSEISYLDLYEVQGQSPLQKICQRRYR